jgi:superfamily I DNA/RNA helicase
MSFSILEQNRQGQLENILASNTSHKLIVAGAGTGKTFTFKCLLQKVNGKCLALTFINALPTEMKNVLNGLAETSTFHSFSHKLLHTIESNGINSSHIFSPHLTKIISSDSLHLLSSQISDEAFGEAFQGLIETDNRIKFFINRANYYNAVGFDDSVYRVLIAFRNQPETIPCFDQMRLK